MKTKKMIFKLWHVVFISLIMMVIAYNSIPTNGQPQSALRDDVSNVSDSKWHPEMFYFILPDLSLSFMLPYEPNQSGVHNLLFISQESGEILLPDTIKGNKRCFTSFLPGSCYDVVLLYNNGKYVKCKDIIFENGLEVDMRNQRIEPSDSMSEQWKKTLRAFDDAIIDRESDKNDRTASKYVTKGYVFSASGGDIVSASVFPGNVSIGDKWMETTADGYFEFDHKDDTEQSLYVGATVHNHLEKPNIVVNSGFIIVLPVFGKASKTPILANCQSQSSLGDDTSSVSAGKWHPEIFYVILTDLSLSFRLPYEPDQSGVHNLLFISKESRKILFPDAIKGDKRYFTSLSSGNSYDVVLLYNNSKYVKCNDIIFENGLEVDMRSQPIQPSDLVSEQWKKTLRAFDDTIVDRESNKNDKTVTKHITKGYVFSETGFVNFAESMGYVYIGYGEGERKQILSTDGYFEFDHEDDTEQPIFVSAKGHGIIKKTNIEANSGLIVVLPMFGKAKKDTRTRTYQNWHPEMFYFILPDLSLSFVLPYEPDQSGVHNLFFISKESGEILLPDTLKDNKRYYTPLLPGSCYDVVLLYNNGQYVKCKNVILENGMEVNMRKRRIKPSNTVSEQWKKTLRAFDKTILYLEPGKYNRTELKSVTKGYVFSALGYDIFSASKFMGYVRLGNKWTETYHDGYFECGNKDDTERSLYVGGVAHNHIEKSNITANSGLIVVLPVSGKASKTPLGKTVL